MLSIGYNRLVVLIKDTENTREIHGKIVEVVDINRAYLYNQVGNKNVTKL